MFNGKYPYVISEVGSNHLGKFSFCKKAILDSKKAGANCVKFQMFDEHNLVHPKVKTYKHIKDKKIKFQFQRFKKVKLDKNKIIKLSTFAKKVGIDFAVTPFNHKDVKVIKNYVTFFKIASGDLNNFLILKEIAKTKKRVVLSTGMSNMNNIKNALKFFNKKKIVLLHCISSYPTNSEDANLENIRYLNKKFNCITGYSDHTKGIDAAISSVFFGAKVIEKHFIPTMSKKAGDFELSINKKQMSEMIKRIQLSVSLAGIKRKQVFNCEKYYEKNLKRSIYSKLKKNEKINENNTVLLRPYNKKGINIENYRKILGKRVKKDLKRFMLIRHNHLKK